MAPPSSQLAGNRTCSPLCPHTLHPVRREILSVSSSKYVWNPLTSLSPWPRPGPAHPLQSSLGPLLQPHHLSAPPLTTNSLSHKKPEGACEHLNQVKSLPRLLRTFPCCHTSKSRKGGKAAGAFLALAQPGLVFCCFFFFSGPAFETPETPGVSTKPTRSFFHILIMLVLMSLPAHLLLSPPF